MPLSLKFKVYAQTMTACARRAPEVPLRIAIIGLGGIGSTFAFYLARTGHHQITAIARPGSLRLQQLQRDRGVVTADGEARGHGRV